MGKKGGAAAALVATAAAGAAAGAAASGSESSGSPPAAKEDSKTDVAAVANGTPAASSPRPPVHAGFLVLLGALLGVCACAAAVNVLEETSLLDAVALLRGRRRAGEGNGGGNCEECHEQQSDLATARWQQRAVEAELRAAQSELRKCTDGKGESDARMRTAERMRGEQHGQFEQCKGAAAASVASAAEAAEACRRELEQLRGELGEIRWGAAAAGSAPWPRCIRRGAGAAAAAEGLGAPTDLASLLGGKTAGCRGGDCSASDVFEASSAADCARVCAAAAGCSSWAFAAASGAQASCALLGSGVGSGTSLLQARDLEVGAKACVPPASTPVEPAAVALAVLASEELQACDEGEVTQQCPDLHDAMRTWRYGIERLAEALKRLEFEHNMDAYVEQVRADADTFLSVEPGGQLAAAYASAASNNRQVFQALRGLLLTKARPALASPLDLSQSRAARGLVCRGACEA